MNRRNLITLAGWLLLLAFPKFESITAPNTTAAAVSSGSTTGLGLTSTAASRVASTTTELSSSASADQDVPTSSVTDQAGTAAEETTLDLISTTDDYPTVTLTITDNETESTETTRPTATYRPISVGSSSTVTDQNETSTTEISKVTDNSSSEVEALTTTKVIEDNAASLTGGEIAAIVICPIVLAVLIPSLVLIILRHKRHNDRYENFYLIRRDED